MSKKKSTLMTPERARQIQRREDRQGITDGQKARAMRAAARNVREGLVPPLGTDEA